MSLAIAAADAGIMRLSWTGRLGTPERMSKITVDTWRAKLWFCVRARIAQRAFDEQFLCAFEYLVELDLDCLHAALGCAVWSFVASERFSHTCFGLPFPSTRATASSRCAGTFLRASYVPCRFRFRPIQNDIYHTTG